MGRVAGIVSWLLLLLSSEHSFHLPGAAPRYIQSGERLQFKVKKPLSAETLLPYDDDYFVNNHKPKKKLAEKLGEFLRGDRVEKSIYDFEMMRDMSCALTRKVTFDARAANDFKEKIDDEYRVNLILDDFPVGVLRQRRDGSPSTSYEHGFRVGFKGNHTRSKEEKYFIHNHLSFRVMYRRGHYTHFNQIVGVEVSPQSKNMVPGSIVKPQEVDKGVDVAFTYDVTFKESDAKWGPRWDTDKPLITQVYTRKILKESSMVNEVEFLEANVEKDKTLSKNVAVAIKQESGK